jgi:FkbM family methyltransferase
MKLIATVILGWVARRKTNKFLSQLKNYQINSQIALDTDFFLVSAFDTDTRNIIEQGVPELPAMQLIIDSLLQSNPRVFENSTAIDIGANYGSYSLFLSRHFNRVISYECHPQTFRYLSINLEGKSNIVCRELAISNSEGEDRIYQYNPLHSGASTLQVNFKSEASPLVYKILKTSLDSEMKIAEFNQRIGLIKLDVEGHEYEALSGAIETINKFHPPIIFEFNQVAEKNQQLLDLLVAIGYKHFKIPPTCIISSSSKHEMFTYLASKKNPIKEFFRIYAGTELLEFDQFTLPKRSELVLTVYSNEKQD